MPVVAPPAGKGNSFATPAPKAAAKPSADAQTSFTTAAKAGGGGASKSSAAGEARAEVPKEVPLAPRKSSQAPNLTVQESVHGSDVDAVGTGGAEHANGDVVEDGAPTRGSDLERRRDELEAMARESSPAKSAASTRRRSKETEQVVETFDYNNGDFGGGFEDEEARGAAFDAEISSRKEDQSEEDEMLSPSRLGRGSGHRQRSASPQLEPDQLDYNAGKVDSAKSKKSKQPSSERRADDGDDDGKAAKAKKPRQAKSPAPAKSAPPRRSARLSPPPAKPQDEKAKSRSNRSGLQDAAGKEEEASESEPEKQSRSRRGAAQNKKKKQVVQPTTKQKRSRQAEEDEDEDEDERETMSSPSELSNEADGSANRRKKTKARVPASKRRKVEKQETDKGDETDYEEQYSLPTKEQRRSDRRRFGKTVAPLKGNGTTRKANQPGSKAAAKGKPGSRAENKPGSKGSTERGSKAGKKGPTKPTSKVVMGTHDPASEMSTEDVEGRVPAQSTRASRSKAKQVVAAVSADGAASSE